MREELDKMKSILGRESAIKEKQEAKTKSKAQLSSVKHLSEGGWL